MKRTPTSPNPARGDEPGPLALLARVYWMQIGNFPMLIFAVGITESRPSPSVSDLGLVGSVLALIAVRYWDVAHLQGRTADGAPATLRHWKRYTIRLVGVAAVLWLLATLFARTLADASSR